MQFAINIEGRSLLRGRTGNCVASEHGEAFKRYTVMLGKELSFLNRRGNR